MNALCANATKAFLSSKRKYSASSQSFLTRKARFVQKTWYQETGPNNPTLLRGTKKITRRQFDSNGNLQQPPRADSLSWKPGISTFHEGLLACSRLFHIMRAMCKTARQNTSGGKAS